MGESNGSEASARQKDRYTSHGEDEVQEQKRKGKVRFMHGAIVAVGSEIV
jgi:hypothetical protein